MVTPISQTITFRSPTGTITGSLTPATPAPGQQTTLTATGTSEAPEQVFAAVDPAGHTCAPTYGSDSGNGVIDDDEVNGAFSATGTFSEDTAGQYVMCLWLADSSSDASPIAGPQALPFTVAAPPPPCVVPATAKSKSLATVENALRAAHCSIGAISSEASRTVPQGKVVGLNPPANSKLANGAAVAIAVSAGPPCVVPVLVRGERVAVVKQAIRSGNCAVGPVVDKTSHVRRGRVVSLSPPGGAVRGAACSRNHRCVEGTRRLDRST